MSQGRTPCLKPGSRSGFTLVELAVTLAVMAIVAAVAVPSFANLVRGNRLVSSANQMVAVFQAARVAAVSNRASVAVCPSTDGSTCTATLGSRWIAVMTKNGASTVLRDTTLHSAITIKSSANLTASNNKFTFTPNGFSAAGTKTSGTLGLCVAAMSGNNGADVSASAGRISTARRAATSACTAPGDN